MVGVDGEWRMAGAVAGVVAGVVAGAVAHCGRGSWLGRETLVIDERISSLMTEPKPSMVKKVVKTEHDCEREGRGL